MLFAEALRAGLVSTVVADADLATHGLAMARETLRTSPDASHVSRRTFEGTFATADFDAALEMDERGQDAIMRANRAARAS